MGSNSCKALNEKVGGLSHFQHTLLMSCSRNYPHLPWTLKHKSRGHHRCQGKFSLQSVRRKGSFSSFRINGHFLYWLFWGVWCFTEIMGNHSNQSKYLTNKHSNKIKINLITRQIVSLPKTTWISTPLKHDYLIRNIFRSSSVLCSFK